MARIPPNFQKDQLLRRSTGARTSANQQSRVPDGLVGTRRRHHQRRRKQCFFDIHDWGGGIQSSQERVESSSIFAWTDWCLLGHSAQRRALQFRRISVKELSPLAWIGEQGERVESTCDTWEDWLPRLLFQRCNCGGEAGDLLRTEQRVGDFRVGAGRRDTRLRSEGQVQDD